MSRFSLISTAALSLAATASASAPIFLTGEISWPGAAGNVSIDAGGDEVVTLRGFVPNAVIGPASVRNSYRVLDVSQSADVSRLLVRGLSAEVTDACIRAHADVVVVHDTHCVMTNGPQSGGVNMPFGLDITAARSVSIEDSSFTGFQWTAAANRYWNGDGITIERGVAGVEFRRVTSNDNSDAGFDVRPFALLSDVSAARNCRNFRFWSGADAGTLTTGDVVKRGGISSCSGIWINGSETGIRPRLHIQRLVVRMTRPATVIEVETGPADIDIESCDIEAPRGTAMIEFDRAPGKVVLGQGCRIDPVR